MNSELEKLKQLNKADLGALSAKKEQIFILTDSHWKAVISLLDRQTELLPDIAATAETLATADDLWAQYQEIRKTVLDEVKRMTAAYQEFQSQVGKLNEQNSTAQKALMDTILSRYHQMQMLLFRNMVIWASVLTGLSAGLSILVTILLRQ